MNPTLSVAALAPEEPALLVAPVEVEVEVLLELLLQAASARAEAAMRMVAARGLLARVGIEAMGVLLKLLEV